MKNLKVLVTRPKEQGERLAKSLTEQGFDPILAPMIKISELDAEALATQLAALQTVTDADGVIAISSNAFRIANQLVKNTALSFKHQKDTNWYAVGQATADAMRVEGVEPVLPQLQFDTDGVLALDALQEIEGKRFILLAGVGGRRKLESRLRARGARVDRVELYKRVALFPQETSITNVKEPDVMIAMSGETVDALRKNLDQTGLSSWLRKPLIVPSARTADIAFDCGFQKVRVTEKASEKSLLQALCRLASEV